MKKPGGVARPLAGSTSISYEQIEITIVIVVASYTGPTSTVDTYTEGAGHIRKRAIAVGLIERGPKTISLPCSARATNTNRLHEAFCPVQIDDRQVFAPFDLKVTRRKRHG